MGRKKLPIFIVLSILAHLFFVGGLFLFVYRASIFQTVPGPGGPPLWVNLGELGISGGGGEDAPRPSGEQVEKPKRKRDSISLKKEGPLREEKAATPSPQENSGQAEGAGIGSGGGPGGSGEGDGSGSGGGGGSNLLGEIRRRIERAKQYPPLARTRRIEGVVVLSFSIGMGGEVMGVTVIRSSGSPILDEEAAATVKRAAPLPYYPNPIRISLRFNLE